MLNDLLLLFPFLLVIGLWDLVDFGKFYAAPGWSGVKAVDFHGPLPVDYKVRAQNGRKSQVVVACVCVMQLHKGLAIPGNFLLFANQAFPCFGVTLVFITRVTP